MRKIINLLIVVLLISGLVLAMAGCGKKTTKTPPGGGDNPPTGPQPLWSLNFDQATVGTTLDQLGFNEIQEDTNCQVIVASDQSKSAPNAAYLYDNSGSKAAYARKELPQELVTAGKGKLVFSIWVHPENQSKSVYVSLYKTNYSSSEGNRLVDLQFSASGNLQIRPAGNTTTICPYNKGEWYTVELTWDSATQKSDVTLNGENKGEFAFEKEGTPDRFELKVGDNSGTNLKAYFDDLALYEVTQ